MLDFLKNRDDCFRQTLLIVLFSLALFYIRHIPMTIINDDLYNTTTGLTTIEFFMHNFKGVGRIFCNGMAWLIYRIPFGLWKVLDSFIYLVIAYLLSYLLEKRYFSWFCLGVCCFPIEKYLSTAGYIVCTTNYIYPFLGLLIALIPLRVAYDRKKQKSFYYVISFIALLYAANNDSFGIGMILFCLCFVLIFSFKNSEEKPIKEMRLAGNRLLLIATIAYLINFFIPGHIYRMTSDDYYWISDFGTWSLAKKIYHGYTSTVATLFFDREPMTLFFISLCSLSIIKKKLAGILPITSLSIFHFINKEKYLLYLGTAEISGLQGNIVSTSAFIVSITVVVLVFYCFWNLFDNGTISWLLSSLMGIGGVTRAMMGLHVSLYASSYRTFTLFSFILLICTYFTIKEISKNLSHDKILLIFPLIVLYIS